MSGPRYSVGGADGCPAGWILVMRAADGAISSRLCADARELIEASGTLDALAIDIPIGIPAAGARECDRATRAAIGVRRSSVFPAPVRAALDATGYRDASDRSFAAHGKRLSQQAFNIIPKIRDVDLALQAAARADARAAARVHEVHPELSFLLLNDGAPMAFAKKRAEGRDERRRLIEREFPGAFAEVRARWRSAQAKDDDILDAFAALWSAGRIASGQALALPAGTAPRDPLGLPMVIRG